MRKMTIREFIQYRTFKEVSEAFLDADVMREAVTVTSVCSNLQLNNRGLEMVTSNVYRDLKSDMVIAYWKAGSLPLNIVKYLAYRLGYKNILLFSSNGGFSNRSTQHYSKRALLEERAHIEERTGGKTLLVTFFTPMYDPPVPGDESPKLSQVNYIGNFYVESLIKDHVKWRLSTKDTAHYVTCERGYVPIFVDNLEEHYISFPFDFLHGEEGTYFMLYFLSDFANHLGFNLDDLGEDFLSKYLPLKVEDPYVARFLQGLGSMISLEDSRSAYLLKEYDKALDLVKRLQWNLMASATTKLKLMDPKNWPAIHVRILEEKKKIEEDPVVSAAGFELDRRGFVDFYIKTKPMVAEFAGKHLIYIGSAKIYFQPYPRIKLDTYYDPLNKKEIMDANRDLFEKHGLLEKDWTVVDPYDRIQHPHIDCEGYPCWGNFYQAVVQAVCDFRLYTAFKLALKEIFDLSPEDAYGHPLKNMKRIVLKEELYDQYEEEEEEEEEEDNNQDYEDEEEYEEDEG